MGDSTLGIVVINFETTFPHKFWVSSWSNDDQYPDGFRYKLLSVRSEPDNQIELVLLLEEPSGDKSEMTRMDVAASAFDRTAATFIDGLADEYGLEFDEVDATHTRSLSEFEGVVIKAGWQVSDVH